MGEDRSRQAARSSADPGSGEPDSASLSRLAALSAAVEAGSGESAPTAASSLDELFGVGGGSPRPRTNLAWALLVAGLTLATVGLACTSAPGAVVVLLAWMVVEKDVDRLESGYLPEDARPQVQRTRAAALTCLGLIVGLFALQGFLQCGGFYEQLWGRLILGASV